jgi:hypothetical protein
LSDTLTWLSYDAVSGVHTDASPPIEFDHELWSSLGLNADTHYVRTDFPELSGQVSPSGRYAIYTAPHRNSIDVLLTDMVSGQSTTVLSGVQGDISQAAWIEGESRVIFDVSVAGGLELYIAESLRGEAHLLSNGATFDGFTYEGPWSVSPDGNHLAVSNLDCAMMVVSLLDDGELVLDELATVPRWTPDGATLCYWQGVAVACGSEPGVGPQIRCHSLRTGETSTLMDPAQVETHEPAIVLSPFTASDNLVFIAFWDGGLWVTQLRK